MSGTIEGGRKAARTNKKLYGSDYYTKVGSLGGKLSKGGGFTKDPERAREAGRKGGLISKRRKSALKEIRNILKDYELGFIPYEEI